MKEIKELNLEELEKVSGGTVDQQTLYFVNQIIKTAVYKLAAKLGVDPAIIPDQYEIELAQEIYEIYLTLTPEEKAMIEEFNENITKLWTPEVEIRAITPIK